MKFVEEVVVEEFLPTFRSMLAEALRKRGLTQHEVAETLGISQSAVSKYAHGEVSRRTEILEDERVRELVEEVAEGLASGDMSRVQALVEAEVLIRRLEERDVLARLHEEAMPELSAHDGYVRIHDPESDLRESEAVRSSVRRALRRLTNASGFAGLIPNVGSNLVACLPDATAVDDVAGVPGRIFDVKGRATVPGDPEFGVSEHVASVLLSARGAGADARAAINVRYDPDIVSTLEAAGYDAVEFDPEASGDPIAEAVAAAGPLTETFVCYQTGGYGIEPITYVLGPDADAVATAVGRLLRG
ncbi:thiamine-phosphate synthase family protein [Halobellus ruber]|uniref:Helix-turn-helix domain-containing protein n=1 Tax=Halobellus ruber TaxID=2761102 RepID=A0A7J9SLW5_9EURY|nr:thiamine-phosphate synthase family protein [Halobellus ruber]MBB6647522.1 helix-turn-helix domain-containing protein [Halobellus ruber]